MDDVRWGGSGDSLTQFYLMPARVSLGESDAFIRLRSELR